MEAVGIGRLVFWCIGGIVIFLRRSLWVFVSIAVGLWSFLVVLAFFGGILSRLSRRVNFFSFLVLVIFRRLLFFFGRIIMFIRFCFIILMLFIIISTSVRSLVVLFFLKLISGKIKILVISWDIGGFCLKRESDWVIMFWFLGCLELLLWW